MIKPDYNLETRSPVAVQVELGQVGQLPEAGRQRGDVGLAQIQPLPPLLPARQERPGHEDYYIVVSIMPVALFHYSYFIQNPCRTLCFFEH